MKRYAQFVTVSTLNCINYYYHGISCLNLTASHTIVTVLDVFGGHLLTLFSAIFVYITLLFYMCMNEQI